MKKPLILCIMDGFAFTDIVKGNAIKAAKTPNLDKIFSTYPLTTLNASGLGVGLPDGQMGNSEVGHTNMGAGRIVYQEFTRITKSIEDGDFFDNEVLKNSIENSIKNNKSVHIYGLMSNGGVHSHIKHCFAILDMCKTLGAKNVFVHPFMDGRDVRPTSGIDFIKQLQDYMDKIGVGKIGTISGRFYAMDRDNRWERIEKAYDTIVLGKGDLYTDPIEHLKNCYENGITDEFTVPFKVTENSNIKDGDSVIFFNFRTDRAREITRCLVDENFDGFKRESDNLHLNYVCFTQYDATMPNVEVAFKPQVLTNTLGEFLSNKKYTQLRIAETEKYAHVTFFFNGGLECCYKGEDRILVPSPKVATYDLKPEMSAYEVTDKLIDAIESDKYDVVILNYANCDMVGHTGVFDATVKAVETVDNCVGKLYKKIIEKDGVLLVTADHGNADKMLDENGNIFTAHTTNRVPFCIINYPVSELRKDGILADIAPTMLEIIGEKQPEEMTGKSIILK